MQQSEFVPDDFTNILQKIFQEMVKKYSGGCEVSVQKCAKTGATFSICGLRDSGAYYPQRLTGHMPRIILQEKAPWEHVLYLSMYSWIGGEDGSLNAPPDILIQIHLSVCGWEDSPSMTRQLYARGRDGLVVPYGLHLMTFCLPEHRLSLEMQRQAVERAAPFPVHYKQDAKTAAA